MAEPIRNITIVGGGTAGWLAANMLSAFFGMTRKGANGGMKITLIESPNIATVGVGEATVPSMARTLQQTGISETQFFKACNASFKLGVRFVGWNVDKDGKPYDFINPFNAGAPIEGHDPGYYYAQFGAGGLNYVQTVSPAHDLAAACKGPRLLGGKPYERTAGYAYHLDAGLFARMLQEVCVGRGVEHILDDMVDVERAENGDIAALVLKEKGRVPVELVLDCTGFRGLLINGQLEEPFESYSKYLANDRAMAVQIPHPDPDRLEPMTSSTALGAGWSWRVPLYNRIGTGYVFSSAHRTDEEARDEFVAFLGDQLPEGAEPRVIPMRIGRSRRAWVNNCIAVGLSGGFIEPLESTAIYSIEMAIRWLLAYFPDTTMPAGLRDRYNEVSSAFYDEVRDFIALHYVLNNRTDTQYWIDAREELAVPDSLAANLDIWQYGFPHMTDLPSAHLFTADVYTAVLIGKGFHEGKPVSKSRVLSRERWRQYLAFHKKRLDHALSQLPDQKVLLHELRGEAAPGTRGITSPQPGVAAAQMAGATVPLPGLGGPLRPAIRQGQRPAAKAPAAAVEADSGGNLL